MADNASTTQAPAQAPANNLDAMMAGTATLLQQATETRKAHTRGLLTGSTVTVVCLALGAVGGWFLHQYVK